MATDRTLIQIRERSYYDLLELALVVVRRRPTTLGLAALAGIAPWAALNAALLRESPEAPWAWFILLAMEAPWATAPLTIVLGGLMFGERPPTRRVAGTLLRTLPVMFLYQGLFRLLLIAFFFTSPLLPSKLGFLNEVILLERGRWRAVPGRSWRLCGDRGGDLFFQWVAFWAFGAGFITAFRWAAEVAVVSLFGSTREEGGLRFFTGDFPDDFAPWIFDLRDWPAHLAIWCVIAFGGVVRFLTYIDRRIRLEGWEVELRLRMVGAAMEDPERW